jgi:hypothetical protein
MQRDKAAENCWDALQRNVRWQAEALELEAAEAFQRSVRTGIITDDDMVKISRHRETMDELWNTLRETTDGRTVLHDSIPDEEGEGDWDQERMPVEEAARQLADLLDRLAYWDFDISFISSDQAVIKYIDHIDGDDVYYITGTVHGWEIDPREGS